MRGFVGLQRIGDVSKEIKRVRAQMEEDEQLASLMRGLRGQNLRDSLFAEDDVQLRLVEVFNLSGYYTSFDFSVKFSYYVPPATIFHFFLKKLDIVYMK